MTTDQIKDGIIINADINASAAIADSKLAQITTASKVSGAALTSLASIPSGAGVIPSANVPSVGTALDIDGNGVDSANSSSEQTLYQVSLPANTLGTGNAVKMTLFVDDVVADSANTDPILRFKYGSTTLMTITLDLSTGITTGSKGVIEFLLFANGSTSAQNGFATVNLSSGAVDLATVAGSDADKRAQAYASGAATEDSTGALNIAVTLQLGDQGVGSLLNVHAQMVQLIST